MPTDDKIIKTSPPVILTDDVLPPNLDQINPSPVDNLSTGSSAPTDDVVNPVVTTTISMSSPKKKYAGGKIIATILGLFLLVGGVGAGVYLTGQNQNIEEKAAACCTIGNCECCGSPRKRQDCRDTNGNGTNDNSASRCEILFFCRNTSCPGEWNSDCAGEDVITTSDTASCQNVKAYDSTWNLLTDANLAALDANTIVNFCVTGTATGGVFTKAMFTINGVLQSETTKIRPSSTSNSCNQICNNSVNPPLTCSDGLFCYVSGGLHGGSGVCRNESCSTDDDCSCGGSTTGGSTTGSNTATASGDFCQEYTIPIGVNSFNVTADIFHEVLGWR